MDDLESGLPLTVAGAAAALARLVGEPHRVPVWPGSRRTANDGESCTESRRRTQDDSKPSRCALLCRSADRFDAAQLCARMGVGAMDRPQPGTVELIPPQIDGGVKALLWLLIGFALLPFTIIQTMIPLAAWLAPIFLLRFSRLMRSGWIALPAIALAQFVGGAIATRGGNSSSLFLVAFGYALLAFHSLVAAAPYAADRWIGSRFATETRTFVFPLAFTAVEWFLSLSRAVNTTASSVYSQLDCLALLQLVSVFGMWGLAFLIGWGASAANALWQADFSLRAAKRAVVPFVAALTAALLFGSARLAFSPPVGPTVKAATVTIDRDLFEATVAPPFDWLSFNRASDETRAAVRRPLEAGVAQLLARTETALRAGAKLVGWQETAARVLVEDRQATIDRAAALAERYGAYLQISLGVFTRAPARPYYLNQSILIDDKGNVAWAYDKTYPVVPSEAIVTPFGPGLLPVAKTAVGRVSTAICNDFHFPALIRQAGQTDADIVMAPYNSLTPYEQQDATVAVMRAIENGYGMVRAAGNGVSLIVDEHGRVLGRQSYGEGGGVMIADLPTHGVATIYSRIGDAFAYLCAVSLAVLCGLGLRRRG